MTDDAQRYRWRTIALGLLALALILCILREILKAGHSVTTISH